MVQTTKRLAQLALDTDRDVMRLTYTLRAFERLSEAEAAPQVEATLAECLVDALGLASARLYVVDRRRKRATSCSGPPTTASWRGAALDQQASLVAWCAADAALHQQSAGGIGLRLPAAVCVVMWREETCCCVCYCTSGVRQSWWRCGVDGLERRVGRREGL